MRMIGIRFLEVGLFETGNTQREGSQNQSRRRMRWVDCVVVFVLQVTRKTSLWVGHVREQRSGNNLVFQIEFEPHLQEDVLYENLAEAKDLELRRRRKGNRREGQRGHFDFRSRIQLDFFCSVVFFLLTAVPGNPYSTLKIQAAVMFSEVIHFDSERNKLSFADASEFSHMSGAFWSVFCQC